MRNRRATSSRMSFVTLGAPHSAERRHSLGHSIARRSGAGYFMRRIATRPSALRRGALIKWESLSSAGGVESLAPEPGRLFEDRIADRQALDAALAMVSPEDAACLLLHALQGFTIQEIGQILGISTEASKKRVARARRRLREAYLALNTHDQEAGS